MRKLAMVICFVLIGTGNVVSSEINKDNIVSISIFCPKSILVRGELNPIILEIKIKAPYHINANQIRDEYYIPTKIVFSEEKGLKFKNIEFPQPSLKKFDFAQSPLPVFEGTITVSAKVEIPTSLKEQVLVISGNLSYQACDNFSCLAPVDLGFCQKFKIKNKKRA
ncbi:MAG: hypothetical protein ACUVXA_07940 [Candidatus Jordarchaeum sp.]|uniref:hypothetical protein n=1 Tax=Candidatus Jordarchaeum sp. TaxID=2823881 RepID=UPI0040493C84